jgi:predicted nucleic acid-binding protein
VPTVYVETSIVSYLRQRPSNRVVAAARQVLTHRWWSAERKHYQLVISQYVLDEASAGNPALARERLDILKGIPLLPSTPEIAELAESIMSLGVLPDKAQVDALHIASVAHHEIDYLLTWNCKHIANAKILPRIYDLFAQLGVYIPVICTPEELLGEDSEDG